MCEEERRVLGRFQGRQHGVERVHKATALIARAKRRQIKQFSRSPQRPAGEPNTGSRWAFSC